VGGVEGAVGLAGESLNSPSDIGDTPARVGGGHQQGQQTQATMQKKLPVRHIE
jgi:hypothetical protein